jgi:hypothetical protein
MTKQPFIDQQRFAHSLIAYVKGGTTAVLGKKEEEPIHDHWTAHNEERGFSGMQCLVAHGLFDTIFDRTTIIPRNWYRFQRQYLSAVGDLLDRLRHECEYPGSHAWTSKEERHTFHMTGDFWDRKTQEDNYQYLLRRLEERKLLRRQASRRYKNDPRAVSVLNNGQWVDIPGDYRTLDLVVTSHGTGSDIPQANRARSYGERVPVMFMMGSTIPYDLESSEGKVYQLVEQHTSPTPKLQDIIYVLAERRNGEYLPRHIGHMTAYMLEFVYGSPSGHIKWDMTYMVPQPDLCHNERQSLDCSMSNWELHHQGFLGNHVGFKSHLTEGK